MQLFSRSIIAVLLAALLTAAAAAQVKKTQRPTAPSQPSTASPTPEPTPEAPKKNGRPAENKSVNDRAKPFTPTYFYEFTRPGFLVSHIVIEHDTDGIGTISFLKEGFPEMLTDPLRLSPVTVKDINAALERLDFLSSTENYQYPKDFSNMGNVIFRYKRDGRERTIKYNWTENKDAKFLLDEYRRISNEAVWKFELAGDRVNQPLNTPRLLDGLDSFLQRKEISDPPHIVPLLKELANDERLPLIARNHATRLIKQIEK